jgi:hypothetical protein
VVPMMEGKRNPHTGLVGIKLVQPLWKSLWRFLKNLWMQVPYDPAISPLGIHHKEYNGWDTFKPMFTAPLFTIAKIWNQSRCPKANDRLKTVQWSISHKDEWNYVICRKMDGIWDHYV